MTKFIEIYGPGPVTYWAEAEESGADFITQLPKSPDAPKRKAVRLHISTMETTLCFIGDEIRFSYPQKDYEEETTNTETTIGTILDIYQDDGLVMVTVEVTGGVWVKVARPSLRVIEVLRKRKDRVTSTKGMVI